MNDVLADWKGFVYRVTKLFFWESSDRGGMLRLRLSIGERFKGR